ncbi:MAG: AlwI family type II restriction endonuclease [Caldisericia bacterium]|nr:AlwI family type II restriction endonuclease [Caldisericia bacterium]
MKKDPNYKPLLFTTTMRNPERFRGFLSTLFHYNGKILTNELAEEIAGELIKNGLYIPTSIDYSIKAKLKEGILLEENEVQTILRDNPQDHKEAGFDYGWPSRFDTWFKFAKELGFVFYKTDMEIQFSKLGERFIDDKHPEYETFAFLNAFVKYQRNNPFRRVKNENVPLLLLLNVIKDLNDDDEYNGAGIARHELPLIIYWKDSNHKALYQRIKRLRLEYGYNPSPEVIVDICQNEIMQGKDKKRKAQSIIRDYPDEFVRKMRLTGIISIRGAGRFIDINRNEEEKINYILETYSVYPKFNTEEEYFQYSSSIDERLFAELGISFSGEQKQDYLKKWVSYFDWQQIKVELESLSKGRLSEDKTLKYLSNPVRLEFLTALAVKSQYPNIDVIPNYPIDDEGLPTSTAGGIGNKGDIECYQRSKGALIEVTMSVGRGQTVMEVWPIVRHLEEFKKGVKNAICYFIAPSIYQDSVRQINYVKEKEEFIIKPKTIVEFLELIENQEDFF